MSRNRLINGALVTTGVLCVALQFGVGVAGLALLGIAWVRTR